MKYHCTVCGKLKSGTEDWRVAVETTAPKGSDIERSILVLRTWDEKRAHEPNAIYFCSPRCEEEYLSVWYGEAELAAAW